MASVPLLKLARYCDRLLRTDQFKDWEPALNGLQVANRGVITRIAAAVDASHRTVRMAIQAKSDLLIVHHGLFWQSRTPWTGGSYELMRLLFDHNLAVYSSHLPLDAHPRLGNNARLCAALGLKRLKPFFLTKGRPIGLKSTSHVPRRELVRRLEKAVGAHPVLVPGGPSLCRQIGVVTGGAGDQLQQAADEGVDTFITGEGPHWSFALAEDLGVNVLYGGHYATETFGVKALARHLARRFNVPWSFLDHPTGL